MTNKKFCLGMLVMVLVFGMMVIGCGGDLNSSLFGTWVYDTAGFGDYVITFNQDGTFSWESDGEVRSGRWSGSGSNITITENGYSQGIFIGIHGNSITIDGMGPYLKR